MLILMFIPWKSCLLASDDIAFDKVPRVLTKQPAYQAKPLYALVTLGSSLQHRHWLVLDGKALYFDRNGNGDITEPNERITATADASDDTQLQFQLGELEQDGRKHVKLGAIVSKVKDVSQRLEAPKSEGLDLDASTLEIWGEFAIPGFRGRCDYGRVPRNVGPFDQHGYLLWKYTPAEASIIHFGETWSVQLQQHDPLFIGIENHVVIHLGSRGLGTGTFAKLGYEKVVPEGLHPRLKLWMADRNGTGPQEHQVVLQERC